MAGRTLGEAWVTIRPDTSKFRAELISKVNAAKKGYNPTVTVSVNLKTDTARLRTQLQTAITSASKGLSTTADVKTRADAGSISKTKAAIDAAARNRTAKITTNSDAEKAAKQYTDWWNKALNTRTLAERMAAQKAEAANDDAAKKATDSYTSWWNKALDAQELKSRQVTVAMKKDLDSVDSSVEAFRKGMEDIKVKTDDAQSKAELNALITRADVLKSTLGNITTNVGVAKAVAQMAVLNVAAEKFKATMSAQNAMPQLGLELTLAQSQFTHLEQNARTLRKEIDSALSPSGITIGKVTDEARKDLLGLGNGTNAVLREIERIRASGGPATPDDIAKVKTLTSGLSQLTNAVAADGVTVKSASGSYRGWVNTLISISRTQIPLFNGALEKMLPHFLAVASGTHILVEAALEMVAVWVPAAMALTVFGLAATKASLEVASDVRNMGIAANGTGQQFQGMAKKVGTSMSQIAKPYVFEAYGLALIALQKQSTTTAGVIKSVGGTLDKWISEAVMAYQKGTGQMAVKGAKDFALLGDAFKQVGTIINGFIKITPGYAEDLLKLGDGVLHVASAVLNSGIAQGFGKIFLALHGAIFYLGLFATLGSKLGMSLLSPLARISGLSRALSVLGITAGNTKGKMATLLDSVVQGWQQGTGKITKAVDDMGFPLQQAMGNNIEKATKEAGGKFGTLKTVASDAMSGLGSKVATAAKGIKGALSGMLSGLGLNPWLIGIAAIGLAVYGLVKYFRSGTDAAKQFGAAATSALNNSSIQTFGTNIKVQMRGAQEGLANANAAFSKYVVATTGAKYGTDAYVEALNKMGPAATGVESGIANMKARADDWSGVISDLQSKNSNFNGELAAMAKATGTDLPTAMNLATAAGINMASMMGDDTTVAAKENVLQVMGLVKAYDSLVNGLGGVNTAYHAMNVQNSQTMKDAQSVASAFQNYTTLITGGANAFDTFVQGQYTLSQNLAATGKGAGSATIRLGALKTAVNVAGASLDGLSPAAVTANSAFLQQVNNAQNLYGSLIQLAAASGNTKVAQSNLSVAGKDMIATLLKTAGGSKEARQQIYSLAQTFGYAGKDTLPDLVKWLGHTGDRTSDLQKRMNGLTAGAGNLANASKALSGELKGQLGQAMSKSIIDAEGGQAAFDKFARAVKKWAGSNSTANYNAMIKAGTQLKQVFINSAGSAKAAEPVLANYMMQLGAGNQHQAKAMADAILGLGGASTKSSKPVRSIASDMKNLAKATRTPLNDFQALQNTMKKSDFSKFISGSNNSRKSITLLAHSFGLNKQQAEVLWVELKKDNMLSLSGHADKAKASFVKMLGQFHIAPQAAAAIWATLSKQNLDMISSKVGASQGKFKTWSQQLHINTDDAGKLWTKLAENNFDPLSGHVDANRKKFINWAGQMGINKSKAADLWNQLLNNRLNTVNAQVDGNKKKFLDLMKQMGETKSQANDLWNKLKEAPHVNASVTVKGGVQGQAQAVAQASGAQKQVIGKLFFAGRAQGGPAHTGVVPGWHNTGDNTLAVSPSGPIALQGGEAIVPKHLASRTDFKSWSRNHGIPGFSGGGAVPGATETFGKLSNAYANTRTNMANTGIQMAGDSIQAAKIGAYNAFVDALGGTGGTATGQAILGDAEKYKGHRYVWGGPSNPQGGWDCSSFAGYVLGHDFHMRLPGGVAWNGSTHGPVASSYNNMPGFHLASHDVNQIQPGDLLVENSGGHVGFGVGPNKMFSAYGTAFGTIFSDAARMTNIYRTGGAAVKGNVHDIVSKDKLTEPMAKLAQKDFSQSSAIKALIAQLNAQYSGNPTGGGTATPGIVSIAKYLMSQGASKAGAAGIASTIAGESVPPGNPESRGSGGWGLIGWTGNTVGLPAGYHGPTGNVAQDMAIQSAGIIGYANARGGFGPFRTATNPVAAGDLWSRYEAPAVALSDTRPAIAVQLFSQGLAKGGKVAAPSAAVLKLEHQHDLYARDYRNHIALMNKDKSKSGKANQKAQALHFANLISQVDAQISYDKAAKIKMPKPANQVVKLATALTTPPWVNTLTGGAGSISPLGWAMQPALGDLMIAKAMGTRNWLGKANIDPQAQSVMANWLASMQSVGGFLNSASGVNAIQLAGKATHIHGRQTVAPKKSFLTGGTIRENVMGVGSSGDVYKFHSGDKVTGPAVAATQAATGGLCQEDRQLLIKNNKLLEQQNKLIAQQARDYAKALNGNVARKAGRS